MCLIIDANVVSEVFARSPKADYLPVKDALRKRKAVAVYGGKLRREYQRVAKLREILLEYDRAGMLRLVEDAAVDRATEVFAEDDRVVSDDPHILGLAEVSKARLLVSHDRDLHQDFTNPDLLSPVGHVYQKKSHRKLIDKHCRGSHRD